MRLWEGFWFKLESVSCVSCPKKCGMTKSTRTSNLHSKSVRYGGKLLLGIETSSYPKFNSIVTFHPKKDLHSIPSPRRLPTFGGPIPTLPLKNTTWKRASKKAWWMEAEKDMKNMKSRLRS